MEFIKKHSTQILVHILFWTLFVCVSLFVFSKYYWAENPFLQYLFILVIIVYANNHLLLPFFVRKKLYIMYILLFAVISFLATKLYCDVFAQCGCSIMKCMSNYLWQTLVPLIFFSFVWMLFLYIDKEKEIEKVKSERKEMELKFLKSQINPHVLFNNLNTIYSYAIEQPEQTPDLILKLSDNLKHVLYESNTNVVLLEKELNFINNYIDFQKIRTSGTKQINYTTEVDKSNYEIVPLLLITIIENAFKHSNLNSVIDIHIEAKNNELICTCTNDFDKTIENNEVAIGLQNLKKRLELSYKDNYNLTIKTEDKFYVELVLKTLTAN